mgnify:CR=1 FL=1
MPTIVIGSTITIGYIDDATTGQEIIDSIAGCRKNCRPDLIQRLLEEVQQPDQASFKRATAPACATPVHARTATVP